MLKKILYVANLGFFTAGLLGGLLAMAVDDMPLSHFWIVLAVLYLLFQVAMDTEIN